MSYSNQGPVAARPAALRACICTTGCWLEWYMGPFQVQRAFMILNSHCVNVWLFKLFILLNTFSYLLLQLSCMPHPWVNYCHNKWSCIDYWFSIIHACSTNYCVLHSLIVWSNYQFQSRVKSPTHPSINYNPSKPTVLRTLHWFHVKLP